MDDAIYPKLYELLPYSLVPAPGILSNTAIGVNYSLKTKSRNSDYPEDTDTYVFTEDMKPSEYVATATYQSHILSPIRWLFEIQDTKPRNLPISRLEVMDCHRRLYKNAHRLNKIDRLFELVRSSKTTEGNVVESMSTGLSILPLDFIPMYRQHTHRRTISRISVVQPRFRRRSSQDILSSLSVDSFPVDSKSFLSRLSFILVDLMVRSLSASAIVLLSHELSKNRCTRVLNIDKPHLCVSAAIRVIKSMIQENNETKIYFFSEQASINAVSGTINYEWMKRGKNCLFKTIFAPPSEETPIFLVEEVLKLLGIELCSCEDEVPTLFLEELEMLARCILIDRGDNQKSCEKKCGFSCVMYYNEFLIIRDATSALQCSCANSLEESTSYPYYSFHFFLPLGPCLYPFPDPVEALLISGACKYYMLAKYSDLGGEKLRIALQERYGCDESDARFLVYYFPYISEDSFLKIRSKAEVETPIQSPSKWASSVNVLVVEAEIQEVECVSERMIQSPSSLIISLMKHLQIDDCSTDLEDSHTESYLFSVGRNSYSSSHSDSSVCSGPSCIIKKTTEATNFVEGSSSRYMRPRVSSALVKTYSFVDEDEKVTQDLGDVCSLLPSWSDQVVQAGFSKSAGFSSWNEVASVSCLSTCHDSYYASSSSIPSILLHSSNNHIIRSNCNAKLQKSCSDSHIISFSEISDKDSSFESNTEYYDWSNDYGEGSRSINKNNSTNSGKSDRNSSVETMDINEESSSSSYYGTSQLKSQCSISTNINSENTEVYCIHSDDSVSSRSITVDNRFSCRNVMTSSNSNCDSTQYLVYNILTIDKCNAEGKTSSSSICNMLDSSRNKFVSVLEERSLGFANDVISSFVNDRGERNMSTLASRLLYASNPWNIFTPVNYRLVRKPLNISNVHVTFNFGMTKNRIGEFSPIRYRARVEPGYNRAVYAALRYFLSLKKLDPG